MGEVGWELLNRGHGVPPERKAEFLRAWMSLQRLVGEFPDGSQPPLQRSRTAGVSDGSQPRLQRSRTVGSRKMSFGGAWEGKEMDWSRIYEALRELLAFLPFEP